MKSPFLLGGAFLLTGCSPQAPPLGAGSFTHGSWLLAIDIIDEMIDNYIFNLQLLGEVNGQI
jgi:hypothetical protein